MIGSGTSEHVLWGETCSVDTSESAALSITNQNKNKTLMTLTFQIIQGHSHSQTDSRTILKRNPRTEKKKKKRSIAKPSRKSVFSYGRFVIGTAGFPVLINFFKKNGRHLTNVSPWLSNPGRNRSGINFSGSCHNRGSCDNNC